MYSCTQHKCVYTISEIKNITRIQTYAYFRLQCTCVHYRTYMYIMYSMLHDVQYAYSMMHTFIPSIKYIFYLFNLYAYLRILYLIFIFKYFKK